MKKLFLAIAGLLVIYVWFTTIFYRFTHPELTETQLFLKVPQALLFKD